MEIYQLEIWVKENRSEYEHFVYPPSTNPEHIKANILSAIKRHYDILDEMSLFLYYDVYDRPKCTEVFSLNRKDIIEENIDDIKLFIGKEHEDLIEEAFSVNKIKKIRNLLHELDVEIKKLPLKPHIFHELNTTISKYSEILREVVNLEGYEKKAEDIISDTREHSLKIEGILERFYSEEEHAFSTFDSFKEHIFQAKIDSLPLTTHNFLIQHN